MTRTKQDAAYDSERQNGATSEGTRLRPVPVSGGFQDCLNDVFGRTLGAVDPDDDPP